MITCKSGRMTIEPSKRLVGAQSEIVSIARCDKFSIVTMKEKKNHANVKKQKGWLSL
jgi:hypothetical protein